MGCDEEGSETKKHDFNDLLAMLQQRVMECTMAFLITSFMHKDRMEFGDNLISIYIM